MARANTPGTLDLWNKVAPLAPYRSSIDDDAYWDVNKPPPRLATAMKVSPGGRLLLAFQLAELRDYFVEGHLDQGAQKEPDGADRAAARKPRPAPTDLGPMDLHLLFDFYVKAQSARTEAERTICEVFSSEVVRLVAEGHPKEAIEIMNSMPSGAMKDIAMTHLMESGQWDNEADPIWRIEPAPYTRERATALVIWQRANEAYKAASATMGARFKPLVDDFVARGDRKGLAELIDIIPNSFEKACVMDALRHRMPTASSSEAPSGLHP